jgi:UDP-GlcNAc:undecaprenyl-phosphate GlcNAc-1-phosphate transferase
MQPLELAIPLLGAFGVALAVTPWVGKLALAVGAVDRPNERKVSRREDMPLLGGLAVAAAFATGLLAIHLLEAGPLYAAKVRGLLIGGAVVLALGVVDDRFGLGARAKFGGQLLAALIAVAHGFEIFAYSNPLTGEVVELPRWLIWIATSFWIVAVTNALNLLDGLDGLASGVAAIIGTTLSVIAWQAGHGFAVCIGIALVGALLGFLPHNFSPARIFLGDTGSLFAGFVLSLLALECYRRVSLITLMVPLLALAVPLLDTALSIVRRVRLRAPIFSADRLHMHHRLLASEGSPRAAVLQFYLLTSAFCLIAVSFSRLEGAWAAAFFVAVVGLTVRLLWNLGALSTGPREPGLGSCPEEGER